jgi:hypothetical protein
MTCETGSSGYSALAIYTAPPLPWMTPPGG